MEGIDKQFDDNQRKELFEEISETMSLNSKLISSIEEIGKISNTSVNIPNIAISLNNKIIELSHQFYKSGISIFSSKRQNSEPTKSFLGNAIVIGMSNILMDSLDTIEQYTSRFTELLYEKQGKKTEKSGLIRRFVNKTKWLINALKGTAILYTKEEREELNSYLLGYQEMDERIWSYNLRDNIIPSIVSYIKREEYDKEKAKQVLIEEVIPDMQKLGLGDLIPELEQKISEAFEEKDDKSWVLSSDERDAIQAGQIQIGQERGSGRMEGDSMEAISTDEYSGEEPV